MNPRSSSTLRAFQADVLGVGLAADRDQQRVRRDRFGLSVGQSHLKPHAAADVFDVVDAGAGLDANAVSS